MEGQEVQNVLPGTRLVIIIFTLAFFKYQMSFSVHVIFFSPVQCVFTGDLNTC